MSIQTPIWSLKLSTLWVEVECGVNDPGWCNK